ncbi:MAG: phosphoribosylformylglycinamidine cyclo-ligase, partial [Candidatus Nanoarchaeia archaeon]
ATRPEMLAPIGGFGGLFKIDLKKHKNPVLVSSIDGIGTKIMVAAMMNEYYSLGFDIVNHCVNDIAVQGAEPLYFLDYIGIGKLRSPLYEQVLSGISDACIKAGCALLGGETAEMPGMYGNDFDIVGVITGVVDKDKIISGSGIVPGMSAIGIASNGLHTNGYSLARNVLFERMGYDPFTELKELGGTIGQALLKPHTSYWPAIKKLLQKKIKIEGMAHITGGGLYDKVPRILPKGIGVVFRKNILPIPPIMTLIVEEGGISDKEAYRVFNMGIGMVMFFDAKATDKALKIIRECGFKAEVIGETVKSKSVPVEII